nr:DNA-binding domain-containing protein [Tanacetum cinerariifolium]
NDEIVHDLNIVSQSKQEEAQANIERNILLEEACRNEVYRTDQTPDGAVSQSELFDYHNQTPDGAVSQSELFGDEDSISINDSDREPETSSEIPVNCLG